MAGRWVFIELATLYEAAWRLALPELPIQYGDFAVWQRQWLTGVLLLVGALPARTPWTDRAP